MDTSKLDKLKSTFFTQQKENIQRLGDKVEVMTNGNKWYLYLSFLGISYFITLTQIAPFFKSYFLIASTSTLLSFYFIVILLALFIGAIYNVMIKILLYFFN